jgi:tRNA 2-thiouridine synthesizing protein A
MSEPLDLRGLKCPLPALLARRALARVRPGDAIEIVADDPLAGIDIPHMCHREGHQIVHVARDGDITRLRIRAAPSGPPAAASPRDPAAR